jgi:hypothetical protein
LSDNVIAEFNQLLTDAFNNIQGELEAQLGNINIAPKEFVRAWGDASMFSSHGASQRAIGGYRLIAVTMGPSFGAALPSGAFSMMRDPNKLVETLNEEQDLRFGINPQLLNAQVGVNSRLLLNNLYLGLHLGYMNLNNLPLVEGFSFDSFSIGIIANYQLHRHRTLVPGLLQWRGTNLGTGFIYQRTNIEFGIPLQLDLADISVSTDLPDARLRVDPNLVLDINVNTFVLPLEATTSIRFFNFLTLAAGLGVDLSFGNSRLGVGFRGDVSIDNIEEGIEQATPGSISVSGGGSRAPSFLNPKLIAGVGFNFGPVIIDLPFIYYPANRGLSLGITAGFVL